MKAIIPSKKIQINNFEHELVQQFVEQMKENCANVSTLSIQGNSYSLDFCRHFSEHYLAKAENLKVFIFLCRVLILMIFLSPEVKRKSQLQSKLYQLP